MRGALDRAARAFIGIYLVAVAVKLATSVPDLETTGGRIVAVVVALASSWLAWLALRSAVRRRPSDSG